MFYSIIFDTYVCNNVAIIVSLLLFLPQFTDDGSHFVSAGKDGNVLVWNLLEVISKHHLPGQAADRTDAPVAKHSHSDHKVGWCLCQGIIG